VVALTQDAKIDGMISLPLFYDSIHFAAPLDSPYASKHLIDLKQLQHERFISLGAGFATAQDFAFAFLQAGFAPDVVMRVDDIFSLINLVSGGVGFSLLPKRIEAFSPRIQLIPLESRYVSRQLITVLIPQIRERDPNLLALAAECRMFSSRTSLATKL
jgi:LysR family malonate utilization transcriptional regulator